MCLYLCNYINLMPNIYNCNFVLFQLRGLIDRFMDGYNEDKNLNRVHRDEFFQGLKHLIFFK